MTGDARRVAVVGGGVAGLSTALAAAPRPVLLLGRARDGAGSASVLAQGGIAAAIGAGDRAEAHARDTLVAGAHHNDTDVVRAVTAAAPEAIAWLQSLGVAFDADREGLQLGREGGHGVARIVHAGGDRTGAVVMATLHARARAAPHIEWRDDVDVDALLLRGGRVAGVRATDAGGRGTVFESDAVVLATGGLGALFARTTNPAGSRGAGLALALAAGARLRDLEFVQFHPTALAIDAPTLPLLTEALRGAGAVLRDARGRPLMAGVHPLGDLAPRDIVARRVWQAAREGVVHLDATRLRCDWSAAFPTALALCRAHGIDPRTTPVPVTAAAHFHMGGIATDRLGRTSVPGLHAVGEVACNGLHGANRLASNSLLEGVACGRWLGRHLAQDGVAAPRNGRFGLAERGPGLADGDVARLREHLWHSAGPLRCASGLAQALADLQPLAASAWEARVACALLESAHRRTHSLGAHWRSDADAHATARGQGAIALAH